MIYAFDSNIVSYMLILITNNTKIMLEPGQIAIHTEPLNVYLCQDRLFTDALELDFRETDCKTKVVEVKNSAYQLISMGVKSGMGEIIARRSMDIIKDITRI